MIYQIGLKLIKLFSIFMFFGGLSVAGDKISVSVESTNIVYDIRVNGIPLIKSKDVTPRSLQIPAYEYFKEGSNSIEVNLMGITKDSDNKIGPGYDTNTSIYVSVVRDGAKIGVLGIYYDSESDDLKFTDKTYTGQASLKSASGVKLESVDNEFYKSKILLGRSVFDSKLAISNFSISNVETLADYWKWENGGVITVSDSDALKKAYSDYYEIVKNNGPEEAIAPFVTSYKLVSMKYYNGSYEDYIEENSILNNFNDIRIEAGKKYKIIEPDFNKVNMEIFGGGRLARFYPDPLKWRWEDRKIDSGIIFYKRGNEFIPYTISTDLNF